MDKNNCAPFCGTVERSGGWLNKKVSRFITIYLFI